MDEALEQFEATDQTVASFCAAEGVSAASFYQWRQKLQRAPGAQELPRFIPVQVNDVTDSRPAVTVRLPSGVSIGVGRDVEVIKRVVAQIVDAWSERPC